MIPTKFGNELNNANVVDAPSLHTAPPLSKHNMIAPRSRQRLILERVAAQCQFELRLQNDNQPW